MLGDGGVGVDDAVTNRDAVEVSTIRPGGEVEGDEGGGAWVLLWILAVFAGSRR